MNSEQTDLVVSLVFGDTEDSVLAVKHVFVVMTAAYGAAWSRSLGASPMSDVHTVWAYQLSQFTHSKAAKRSILWALQNLPDTPPSAMAFRNLCRMAPAPQAAALPEPKADPARIAAALAKLAPLRERLAAVEPIAPRAWAHDVICGRRGRPTPQALRMAKDALGMA